MNWRAVVQASLVTATAAVMVVACGPRNHKAPVAKKADRAAADKAMTAIVKAAFGDEYDPKAERNVKFTDQIVGMEVITKPAKKERLADVAEKIKSINDNKIEVTDKDKDKEVTTAMHVNVRLLLTDEREPLTAEGTLTLSKDFTELEFEPEHCGQKYNIVGKCMPRSNGCGDFVIMVSKRTTTSVSADTAEKAVVSKAAFAFKAEADDEAKPAKITKGPLKSGNAEFKMESIEKGEEVRRQMVEKGELRNPEKPSCEDVKPVADDAAAKAAAEKEAAEKAAAEKAAADKTAAEKEAAEKAAAEKEAAEKAAAEKSKASGSEAPI